MAANDRMLNFKSVSCFSGDICKTLDFNEVISKTVNEKVVKLPLYYKIIHKIILFRYTLGKCTRSNSEVCIQYPVL